MNKRGLFTQPSNPRKGALLHTQTEAQLQKLPKGCHETLTRRHPSNVIANHTRVSADINSSKSKFYGTAMYLYGVSEKQRYLYFT